MSHTFCYASILHAVGQVLDQVGVKSIAIREEEHGLCIEGLTSDSQLQIHYTIADLYDLVGGAESQEEEPTATPTVGLLCRFLAEHNRELVGAAS